MAIEGSTDISKINCDDKITPSEYLNLSQRTNHTKETRLNAASRLSCNDSDYDINHGLIGLMTELGELADVHKKWINYGKKEDLVNMSEELGDLFWYISIIINSLNQKGLDISFESIMKTNI